MIKAMRSFGLSLLTIGLTTAVIGNAYYQKKQFYPSVVYITKSNPSMAVIYVQSLVFVLMLGKLMRKIFLGSLRAAEFEHLMERFWYALTETCLAFTVFRDDFNPKFVALFTVLLFLKSFHWLAEDRVDYMERSPMIGWLFHVRVASLLIVLACLDYVMISHAYHSTITKGATVQLVFGFEYAILITVVANIAIKYILHATEMRSETPWDNKAVFLLYTELVIGLGRVILYVLFVFIMVRLYTLPLFAFRPMYYTIRSFKKALDDVILSRRAIRNMNTLYPDATPEELALSDNICIICREDMVNSSKKLPCGHIFHTACLRSWFQRQQTCPTCRLNILRTPITVAEPQRPAPVQQNAVQNNENEQNRNANQNNNAENVNPFASLFPSNFVTPQLNFPLPTAAPINMEGNAGITPPLPFMTPYALPPPPMPPALENLSEEELRALEGTERQHVEERIKLLRNIQLMLNASVALMNQYNSVVARLPPPPPIIGPIPTMIPVVETPPPVVIVPAASIPTASVPVVSVPVASVPAASVPEVPTIIPEISAPFIEAQKPSSSTKAVDIKIEDIGSEEHLDIPSASSSNHESVRSTSQMNFNFSSDTIGDAPETEEIRRRRLQKFLQSEKEDGTA